jgi:hypothetical protein
VLWAQAGTNSRLASRLGEQLRWGIGTVKLIEMGDKYIINPELINHEILVAVTRIKYIRFSQLALFMIFPEAS